VPEPTLKLHDLTFITVWFEGLASKGSFNYLLLLLDLFKEQVFVSSVLFWGRLIQNL
jgi:hypothetical protein